MKIKKIFVSIFLIMCIPFTLKSEELWEVTTLDNTSPGYLKFDVDLHGYFFLVDNYGQVQYIDSSFSGANGIFFKKLRNGYWTCFSLEGNLEVYNQDFEFIGSIGSPENLGLDFHDIEITSDGNFIFLGIETRVMDLSEVVDGGRTDASVNGVVVVELNINGEVLWTWNSFEYFDITDVTDDIDLTQPAIDFTHSNALSVDLDDNILLSSRHLDEITKINRTTGEIMWRMGGTACENNEFDFLDDIENDFYGFSHQHAITVLANGNYLLYDNGNMKPVKYSRAVEYEVDVSNMIVRRVWEYRETPDFYNGFYGNAQRLENGNTLINWGTGKIIEVRQDHSKAFELILRGNQPIYRAFRYIENMDVVLKNINSNGTYVFNDDNEITGITLDISSLNGSAKTSIEKHYYAASGQFNDTNFSTILPYRWVLSKHGISSIAGNLKIKLSDLNNISDPTKLSIFKRNSEANGVFVELNTNYNSSNNELYASFNGLGEFVIVDNVLNAPNLNKPNNSAIGQQVAGTLQWYYSVGSKNYKLQIAEDRDFNEIIKDTVLGQKNVYNYYGLDNSGEYFWRVAAINSKDTSDWSAIFSFNTKLAKPELLSPVNNEKNIELNCTFDWEISQGTGFYWLQISYNSQFNQIENETKELTNNEIELELEKYYTDYFWRVRCYIAGDTSDWSDIRTFRTELPLPQIISPSNNDINIEVEGELRWYVLNPDIYFALQLDDDSLFKNIIIEKESVFGQKFKYDKLKNNTEYFWKIRSIGFDGEIGEWTETNTFITRLTVPKLLVPANNLQINTGDIEFKWNSVPGGISYTLQLSYDMNFSNLFKEIEGINDTAFVLKNFSKDTILYWKIQARDGNRYSNWSENRKLIISIKNELFAAPFLYSPLDKSKNEKSNGFLIWNLVQAAKSYEVEISKNQQFLNPVISEKGITKTFFEYNDLKNDSLYFWRVRAVNNEKISDWSQTWMFSIIHNNTESKNVILLAPINDEKGVELKSEFSWQLGIDNEDIGIRNYRVELSYEPDFKILKDSVKNFKNNNYIFQGLETHTKYFWRVGIGINDSIFQWSEIWFFETELKQPEVLEPMNGSENIPLTGWIKWTEVPGANNYCLMVSYDSTFSEFIVLDTCKLGISYNYNLLPDKLHFWRVKAENEYNVSQWTDVHHFKTMKPIGVEDEILNQDNIIFNADKLNLELYSYDIQSITIFNLNGIEVKRISNLDNSTNNDKIIIDVCDFPAGLYCLISNNSNKCKSFLFIVF